MRKARKSFHSAAYRRFQRRLQQARIQVGFTQRQVAQMFGRPASFVAKIETGERRVDFIELQALASLYKRPLSYFED